MSFEYPAGLWSLLGVLVLIAVYLVRRKYDETTVSSTYLWQLALRMQKKKQKAQRIKRALLFALQLICIVAAALLIAQPHVVMPGADTHYAAILDGSGSMRIGDAQGVTRFERAVEMLEHDTQKLPWGSSVTVILAGDEAKAAAVRVRAGSDIRSALEGLSCGFGEGDLDGAVELLKGIAKESTVTQVCLYTDQDFTAADGIAIADVRGTNEWNVSVASLEAQGSIYGTEFVCSVVSSGRDVNVAFELYVDGEPVEGEALQLLLEGGAQTQTAVLCPADEPVSVSLLARKIYDYSDVRVVARAEDGLAQDNEYRLYAPEKKTVRVLLAGERTHFLEAALSVFPRVDLTTEKTADTVQGYDLYVYNGCLPEKTPEDGAVVTIDTTRAPKGSGVQFGEELMGAMITADEEHEDPALLQLTENLTLQDAAVVRFREVKDAGAFEPVLLCGRFPLLLAGKTPQGYTQMILPFDFQDTNLPLLPDYVVLMNNILAHCVPPLLPERDYASGVRIMPKTLPKCEKLFLQTSDMRIHALGESELQEGVLLSEPGSYTLMQELAGGKEQILSFFVHMPSGESAVSQTGEPAVFEPGIRGGSETHKQEMTAQDGESADLKRLLAAVLLLALMVEWVVYHREKY